MTVETYLGIISAVIAVVSALISVYFSHRSILSVEKSRKQQYFIELRQWADETSNILSSVSHLCATDSSSVCLVEEIRALKIQLSSLIDRGRWFFPNVLPEMFGQNKSEASKGIRKAVLTRLVLVYRELEKLPSDDNELLLSIKAIVDKNRQLFVSDIHIKLDPRSMNKEFDNM